MRETWYVLDDDSVVHPGEVDHSNMTHKNGKIAMRGDAPSTRGVEVDEKTGKRVYTGNHDHEHKDWAGSGNKPKPSKDAKADDDATAAYKTRDAKAK